MEDFEENVTGYIQCQELCVALDGCSYFTWNKVENVDQSMICKLFQSVNKLVQWHDCISGPAHCPETVTVLGKTRLAAAM